MSAVVEDEPAPSALRRARLVGAVALFRFTVALVVALPIGIAAARAAGSTSGPDAVLFEPGGMMLLEALRLSIRSASSLVVPTVLLLAVASIAGTASFAVLAEGFARKGPLDAARLAARALATFPALVLLGGLALVAEAIVFVVVDLLGNKLVDLSHASPPSEDFARAGAALVALLAAGLLGAAQDLVRAAVVVRDLPLVDAVRAGFRALGSRPLRLMLSWLVLSLGSLLVLGLAGYLAPPLAPIDAPPLLVAFAVHQAAFLLATFVRASWIAVAVERVLATTRPRVALERDEEPALADGSSPVAVVAPRAAAATEATPALAPPTDVDATWKSAGETEAAPREDEP